MFGNEAPDHPAQAFPGAGPVAPAEPFRRGGPQDLAAFSVTQEGSGLAREAGGIGGGEPGRRLDLLEDGKVGDGGWNERGERGACSVRCASVRGERLPWAVRCCSAGIVWSGGVPGRTGAAGTLSDCAAGASDRSKMADDRRHLGLGLETLAITAKR